MLLDAFVIASLCGISILYFSDKMPEKLKQLFKNNPRVADLIAFLSAYVLLGGTMTSLVAGIMLIGVVESMLYIAQRPEEFLYLWDLKKSVEERMDALKRDLSEFGNEYRERTRPTIIDATLQR